MHESPIVARKIKISVPLRPEGLPAVPLDGPIGDLTLQLTLEGSGLAIPARINGKSYRRMLRTVAEKGAGNVAVILQGDLVAPPDGGPVRLDSAGFQVIVKAPPVAQPTATGIDWEHVGIGAGGMLGASLIALGGALLVVQRRGARAQAAH